MSSLENFKVWKKHFQSFLSSVELVNISKFYYAIFNFRLTEKKSAVVITKRGILLEITPLSI